MWSRFTFPGRKGKYSKFVWDYKCFTGTDRDEITKEQGQLYCFSGKKWEQQTDVENGNFDYLMGCDVDMDNHDTQYGQSLQSFIEDWFKPLAYAIVLLRNTGRPCVFYSDYYGHPSHNRPAVPNLKRLIMLRRYYAYGEQKDYFDDFHVVGWTRAGDDEHSDSGMSMLLRGLQ